MKGFPSVKGLGDIRTATTHHVPVKPPQRGTFYLDLFSLSIEKERLGQELAGIERRRKRLLERLAEVRRVMEKLEGAAPQEKASQNTTAEPGSDEPVAAKEPLRGRPWKKMALEY